MSLSEALGKVSLKKTENVRDGSNPTLKSEMTEKDILDYQRNVLDYNFELWIKEIEEYTFRSLTVPLTREHAQAFIYNYAKNHPELQMETTDEQAENGRKIILSLEKDLSEAISKIVKREGDPVFVKTSCRSAKDAPITQGKMISLFKKYLSEMEKRDDNDKIHAMLKAGTELMQVFTAKESLDLMLSSERIFQDMQLAMAVPDRWDNNLIVREWVTIDVDMEFRSFVYDGKLTAISQYNHLVFFPRLLEMKEDLEMKIKKFWEEKIRDKLVLKLKNYVIDFAVVGDDIWVIELNPFLETTDGALFSWQKERDLLEGKKEFEFRLRDRVAKGAKSLLAIQWRELLNIEV